MASTTEILACLDTLADPRVLASMSRFGIPAEGRIGVSMPALRKLAKEIGCDHALALELWKTGIGEARIVASLVADPALLTGKGMDQWVQGFDSWDVCDQVCLNLFDKSPHAVRKINAWAKRKEEFVKRAAFALMACVAWHQKEAPNSVFIPFFTLIERAATDDRNFVKKAVNWALRNIGKRNAALNAKAIACARRIQRLDSRPARWIAADALRELSSVAVRSRLERRGRQRRVVPGAGRS